MAMASLTSVKLAPPPAWNSVCVFALSVFNTDCTCRRRLSLSTEPAVCMAFFSGFLLFFRAPLVALGPILLYSPWLSLLFWIPFRSFWRDRQAYTIPFCARRISPRLTDYRRPVWDHSLTSEP
ncbi:hypothetical protein PGT21_030377 [Puccinia graminis f. sp. tritici]|uniref:Uncharacterized protein n=1 Tax=Puccinia graminis f. sp. tritici TaxID=56615 RepID=A0A5B0M8B8_PUCGR|nr:hypothetical protein PGT21_030377 [Puccinia graminis f. sp. tritici]